MEYHDHNPDAEVIDLLRAMFEGPSPMMGSFGFPSVIGVAVPLGHPLDGDSFEEAAKAFREREGSLGSFAVESAPTYCADNHHRDGMIVTVVGGDYREKLRAVTENPDMKVLCLTVYEGDKGSYSNALVDIDAAKRIMNALGMAIDQAENS